MQNNSILTIAQSLMASGTDIGIGSIVYIGCGLASDLADYRDMAPERIYLVEPNPELATDLHALVDCDPLLIYLPLAVGKTDGQSHFNIFNHFDICSLATPNILQKIYPGARLEASVVVQTVTLATLINGIVLSRKLPNLLVIEAVGSEGPIVAALTQSDIAARFGTIVIGLPAEPLFDDSRIPDLLAADMARMHYQQVASDRSSNPDWARSVFCYSPTLADRDKTVTSLKTAHTEEVAALKDAQDKTITTLKTSLDDRDKTVTSLKTAHTEEVAALKANMKTQLSAQRTDYSMAQRLRTLHDNDLRDLQDRLQKTERDRAQLEDLLRAVTVQLRAAAQYAALLKSNPTAELPEALSSDNSADLS